MVIFIHPSLSSSVTVKLYRNKTQPTHADFFSLLITVFSDSETQEIRHHSTFLPLTPAFTLHESEKVNVGVQAAGVLCKKMVPPLVSLLSLQAFCIAVTWTCAAVYFQTLRLSNLFSNQWHFIFLCTWIEIYTKHTPNQTYATPKHETSFKVLENM